MSDCSGMINNKHVYQKLHGSYLSTSPICCPKIEQFFLRSLCHKVLSCSETAVFWRRNYS